MLANRHPITIAGCGLAGPFWRAVWQDPFKPQIHTPTTSPALIKKVYKVYKRTHCVIVCKIKYCGRINVHSLGDR